MGYLNEDGLETLVGKIKGQAIELTSAEYRQLPATKNTDNKLYFVTDEAYAYQIDDEPTANSSGLVKSGGVYNWTSKIGSGTLTTTAQTLIPAVNEVNAKIGSTDISAIGDGTLTGAVDALNAGLDVMSKVDVSSSSPADILLSNYGSMLLIGFVQNVGSVILGVSKQGSTLSVRNLLTNSDFSNTNLTFTANGNYVTMSSTATNASKLTVIAGGNAY